MFGVGQRRKEKVGQLLCQAFEDTDPPVLEIAEISILSSTSTLSTYMWDPEDLLTPLPGSKAPQQILGLCSLKPM